MSNPVGNLLHKINNENLNILTFPTHERYETNLCKTGFNFFAYRTNKNSKFQVKDWNFDYGPLPDNYILLDPDLDVLQIPKWTNFDLILSQNKFGQYQIATNLAKHLQIPLVSLEHTLPVPDWPTEHINNISNLFSNKNVYISEFSRRKWMGNGEVIHHGINSDVFINKQEKRESKSITVVNDFVNRDWCQPEGQKILTSEGYVPIEKINVGDSVLTDSGLFNIVTKTFKRKYFGDIIVIKLDSTKKELMFTPEHAVKVYRDGQEKFIKSNRLRIGDKLKFPKLVQTDFYLLDNEYNIDFSYLIGNIIADGHITKNGNIQICVEQECLERANRLKKILNNFVKTVSISDRNLDKKSIYLVEATSKIFGNWLKDKIGDYGKIKSIPSFIMNGCDNIRLSVLRGLWDCDGSFNNGKNNRTRFSYSTTSVKLASQVSSLLHHFGIKCNIIKEKRTTNKSNGKIVSIYRVQSYEKLNYENCFKLIKNGIIVNKNQYSYTVSSYEIEEYNDYVYNCEVSNYHSYVVSPGFVVHNCCGYSIWDKLVSGLDKTVIGSTPGLSSPADSIDHLVDLYNSHTIYLNTSTVSPVPTALLEAMACGCCPISTATCMIPEIIQDGVNGFISNDERVLRNHLERLMNNPDEAAEIGLKARETVVREFGLYSFIDNWKRVLLDSAQIPYRGELHV